MPKAARVLAALLLLAPACAEDSSFVLRWRVGRTDDDAAAALTSVRQCSDLGLSRVRVTTLAADGTEEDVRDFPCFPDEFAAADGAAPGPELGPGTYYVSILGLTRRGQSRPDPDAPDDDDAILARDQAEVVVRARGEGVLVDSFKLVGIDECHDGIDNDRDGAVDQSDAPCRRGEAAEDLDSTGAQFTFVAVLLGDNPRATCGGLGIDRFRVTLDGDEAVTREIPCTLQAQGFSADLTAGSHTWSVEGLDATGAPVTAPIVGEAFEVQPKEYRLVEIAVDFTLDTFLAEPAFAEPLRFALEFESTVTPGATRLCSEAGSDLVISTVALTFLADTADASMVPVETVEIPAIPLTYPLVADCLAFQKVRTTTDLLWSAAGNREYYLRVDAFGEDPDVACFSNAEDPARLAPGADLPLTVPRVPGACAD
jgi:hypothetical protein